MEMDLKVVAHAKEYIDALARGINPLTKEEVKEDDVVNQVRISRCLYYVSDVLEAVLHNGGVRVILEEQPFVPDNIDLSLFVPEEQAMPVSILVGKINELKPPYNRKSSRNCGCFFYATDSFRGRTVRLNLFRSPRHWSLGTGH